MREAGSVRAPSGHGAAGGHRRRLGRSAGVGGAGGESAFHTLAVQKQEDYGVLKQFGAAHTVRIYADPGSTIQVSVGRVPFAGTANATVTLSGRLEDVP